MSQNPSYCVFRKGSVWLALPAMAIREVMPRPRLVAIPRTRPVLSGLCHIRSEFVPVLNLSSLCPEQHYGNEEFLLIIEESAGDWGLLIDEVSALAVLEPSDAPDSDRDGWESTVTGWATYQEQVVRILDEVRFREVASQELNPAFHAKHENTERPAVNTVELAAAR